MKMQFKITSQDQSKAVQAALFAAGYQWASGNKHYLNQGDNIYLTAHTDMDITFGWREDEDVPMYVVVEGKFYREGEEPKFKFKAGDKVICIENNGCGFVNVGQVYTVTSTKRHTDIEDIRVELEGVDTQGFGVFQRRFEVYVEPAQPKFKAGDRVRVIAPASSLPMGAEYDVLKYDEAAGEIYLNDGTNSYWFDHRFEVVEPEPEPAHVPKFAVGDKVICNRGSMFGTIVEGSQYTIAAYAQNDHEDEVKLEGNGVEWWYVNRFDLVKPEPVLEPVVVTKFKAGDKVLCMSTSIFGTLQKGETYTVVEVDGGTLTLEGIDSTWSDHRFELAPAEDVIVVDELVDDTRPPLGLRPQYIADLDKVALDKARLIEILEAMLRYANAGKAIPDAWDDEYDHIRESLNEYYDPEPFSI